MPGFGADRAFARGASSEKQIKKMTINFPQEGKGDTSVDHEHLPPHPVEQFRFAANEGEALAAHVAKHLALRLPGKAATGDTEGEVAKSDFGKE